MTVDLDGLPGAGLAFAARAAALAQPERALYRRILAYFIEGEPLQFAPPSADEVAPLIDADLVQTDAHGRVTVAYPFSAQRTLHRVALNDGRSYHAMCAIDALGIPFMLHEGGEVRAREPDGRQIVHVTLEPESEPTWTPAPAVAVAASGDGCSLAQSACPHINIFASPDAATRYLHDHALQGSILSIADAATAGQWLFGDLLNQPTDATAD